VNEKKAGFARFFFARDFAGFPICRGSCLINNFNQLREEYTARAISDASGEQV